MLLFVAHRDEILLQSQSTFRHILRNGSFGERFVGGERPSEWRHVFASVQSLAKLDLDELDPALFDMVIVDEFHHAGPETKTYARLLNHLKPKVVLGEDMPDDSDHGVRDRKGRIGFGSGSEASPESAALGGEVRVLGSRGDPSCFTHNAVRMAAFPFLALPDFDFPADS